MAKNRRSARTGGKLKGKEKIAHLEENVSEAAEQHFQKLVGEEVQRQVSGILDQLAEVFEIAGRVSKILPVIENLDQTVNDKVVEVVKPAVDILKQKVNEQAETFAQQIDSSLEAKLEPFKPLIQQLQAAVQGDTNPSQGEAEAETAAKRRLPIGSLLNNLDVAGIAQLIQAFKGGTNWEDVAKQVGALRTAYETVFPHTGPDHTVLSKYYADGYARGLAAGSRGSGVKKNSSSPSGLSSRRHINSALNKPSEIDRLLGD